MAHAVDFVLKVMKELSSSEPALFQRDGSLYVASDAGLGQVTYGLRTQPVQLRPYEKKGQPAEIAESENAIHRFEGEYDPMPVFKSEERPYIQAIMFGPDSDSFTLKDIRKVHENLSKLPDDNRIRMVSHGSRYHSHKYGYANDGTDFWLKEARSMNRDRYLELMRQKEDSILQEMETRASTTVPNYAILTPGMLISFPRGGVLSAEQPYSWTSETYINTKSDNHTHESILLHSEIDRYYELPFNLYAITNSRRFEATNTKSLFGAKENVLRNVNDELNTLSLNMPMVEGFLERMNSIHQKLYAEQIQRQKNLNKSK